MAVLNSAKQSAASRDRPGLEMLMLALSGKATGGFEKVVKMIDDLVQLLGKEQTEDDDKKEYCALQFDAAEDKKKAWDRSVAGEEASIAGAKETVATLTQEIAALEAGIRALDKSVADATAQRKDEHAEFQDLVASDTAAQEVLSFAKNRLNKFYNPKLYKPPPQAAQSDAERISGNFGDATPTAAAGGIAGTGITVLAQVSMHAQRTDAPGPPP